jgi:hypothetical protein
MSMKTALLASVMSASALVLGGCNSATNQPPAQTAQPTAASRPSAVTSPVSINAEMVSLVDHAAHELWSVEQEGRRPKTPDDWENLSEHATQLAAAAALIALPGTGPNDNTLTQQPKWQKWAKDMSDVGMAELEASRANNIDALLAANNRLVDVCEGCHKEFKPAIPSEGIAHKHMHTAAKP